jgi:hypothetical protein
MPDYGDEPMYRTFEEFEREEMRRADSIGAAVDELFDELLVEDLNFDASSARHVVRRDYADDEE